MSAREDLEHLAEECETCALEADESIDSHLIQCQSCTDHVAKAEEIDRMVQQMAAVSKQTEEERSDVLVRDIEGYLAKSAKERDDAMTDMFDNVSDLNEAQRTVIIKTRTDIMTTLPKGERDKMMHSARHIYAGYDMDRKVQEEQAILTATEDYNPLKRTLVRRMYRNLMK
jgi:isochorismate hydrolase